MKNEQVKENSELELLAPAGNLEKLQVALRFGADAVYFGLPDFSLRARSNNFTKKDIVKAQSICQREGRKFYLTMNIYAHNIHLKQIIDQLKWLQKNKIKPAGIIASDPGIIRLIKKYLPDTDIHLSTQANATNIEAVKFWRELGVTRVVLAREVTLEEIKEIHQAVPEMELEVFVHGAMCMSYSGRCILSKWMTNRSANLGDCAQPCRWKWSKQENNTESVKSNTQVDLVDDKERFGMRVEEDQHGTYMFNSYDISLLEYMDKLIDAGVVSFKIEGRAKSVYYVAVIVRAYRKVIDAFKNGIKQVEVEKIIREQAKELNKMSNRGYWTGFILGNEPPHLFDRAYKSVDWEFAGISISAKKLNDKIQKEDKEQEVFVHNKLAVGDRVEIITKSDNIKAVVENIKDQEEGNLGSAHGGLGKTFQIRFNKAVPSVFLIRVKK